MSESVAEPLGYLLHRLAAVLRPQMAAELGELGLGLPEFVCLRILATCPGRSGAELARDTHVSAQAMNQVLHRLESMGAVTRPPTAPAGRARPAELTGAGKRLLTRAERAVHRADQRVLDGLTPTEQRRLKGLLRKAGMHDAGLAAVAPGRGDAERRSVR
ncbi:MarR family winged helix-turn-helix transcriptional regulator [Mycolicibacterium palauense]|uniref:MarR family winged helix-turn-helix transcriptional regulator n=1 Tax=Mycolicibacterium palauense TaxID=2034511 RepID=UPI001FE8A07D|nr:MarR family transcriptional regulator [Mycolicibacterium palauense]